MPSKKPMITFHTEQWIIDEMKRIAQESGRSMSKEIEMLCRKHIQENANRRVHVEDHK